MTAVGIDVSKGKSTVALLSDTGEVLKKPYDAPHTRCALSELAKLIKECKDDVCVVMEATGNYHKPVTIYKAGETSHPVRGCSYLLLRL